MFFKLEQNKIHWAVYGQTATEKISAQSKKSVDHIRFALEIYM